MPEYLGALSCQYGPKPLRNVKPLDEAMLQRIKGIKAKHRSGQVLVKWSMGEHLVSCYPD